jgi:hypothetical protein
MFRNRNCHPDKNCPPDRSFPLPKRRGSGAEAPAVLARRSQASSAHAVTSSLATTCAAIALLALASVSASAQAHKPASTAADLPPGTMQSKATTACTECHEARIILQQRLTKPAWGKEVDKMAKWGAVVDPADRDALIDYLSTNFGPDQPAYDPPRTATDKSSSGRSK